MTKKKMTRIVQHEGLSGAIPARLFNSDATKLREYEKKGLNISDIIRKCVNKALPEVVREIRESLSEEPSSTRDEDRRRLAALVEAEHDRKHNKRE